MEEQDGQDQQAKVKQEPYEEEGLNHHHHQHDDHDEEEEEEERSLAKRPKMELVDAEANTVHTGELRRIESFLPPSTHSLRLPPPMTLPMMIFPILAK